MGERFTSRPRLCWLFLERKAGREGWLRSGSMGLYPALYRWKLTWLENQSTIAGFSTARLVYRSQGGALYKKSQVHGNSWPRLLQKLTAGYFTTIATTLTTATVTVQGSCAAIQLLGWIIGILMDKKLCNKTQCFNKKQERQWIVGADGLQYH